MVRKWHWFHRAVALLAFVVACLILCWGISTIQIRSTGDMCRRTGIPRIYLAIFIEGLAGAAFLLVAAIRDRWIRGSMLVAFLAAQSFHGAEFERYYEPPALIWLAIAAGCAAGVSRQPVSWLSLRDLRSGA